MSKEKEGRFLGFFTSEVVLDENDPKPIRMGHDEFLYPGDPGYNEEGPACQDCVHQGWLWGQIELESGGTIDVAEAFCNAHGDQVLIPELWRDPACAVFGGKPMVMLTQIFINDYDYLIGDVGAETPLDAAITIGKVIEELKRLRGEAAES